MFWAKLIKCVIYQSFNNLTILKIFYHKKNINFFHQSDQINIYFNKILYICNNFNRVLDFFAVIYIEKRISTNRIFSFIFDILHV